MVTQYASWTGTPGCSGSDLPEGWVDAGHTLEQRLAHKRPPSHVRLTSALVAQAWSWLLSQFPADEEEITKWPVRDVVDFYVYQ